VTVENAFFPQQIKAAAAQGTTLQGVLGALQFTGSNTANLLYTAPVTPDASDPEMIQVTDTATTGARAAGAPTRFGTATIRFSRIEIAPRPPCVDTLEQVTFTAEVTGHTNKTVTWTADVGMINAQGRYTGPPVRPASGTATVRATSNADPELTDSVTFTIGCTCNYRLTLEGETFVAQTGDRLVFATQSGRLFGVTVQSGSKTVRLLPLDGNDPNTWPNGVGTFAMHIQGSLGLTDPTDILYATDAGMPHPVTFTAFQPFARLVGSISGATVGVISTQPPPRQVGFDLWFSITYPPGDFQCVVGGGS
jgi:hypothetical protein